MLTDLQGVRVAEQQVMMECFEQLVATVEGANQDLTSWRVSDWIEWFGTVRLLSSIAKITF